MRLMLHGLDNKARNTAGDEASDGASQDRPERHLGDLLATPRDEWAQAAKEDADGRHVGVAAKSIGSEHHRPILQESGLHVLTQGFICHKLRSD